jgi:quercetin dioxygenase-like cupin family protein
MISTSLFVGLMMMLSANEQDLAKVATDSKVKLDNDQVRVIEIVSAPGQITAWHSHPDYILYALTDGKLEVTDKDKPAKVLSFKAGDTMFMPAVTHMVKNVGPATMRMLVTELKNGTKK